MLHWKGGDGRRPRLLIGDRSPLVAAALAALLDAAGYDIAACAGDGATVHAAITDPSAVIDIALLDIDLVDPAPLALLAPRTDRGPRPWLVLTAPGADHPGIAAAVDSSARGLVLKSEAAESLTHCLASVAAGGRWIDSKALAIAADRSEAHQSAAQLTRRERDVARLVATGKRNRCIAGTLGISEGTVKMHLHNVYSKLGLESRTQLAMDERLRQLG